MDKIMLTRNIGAEFAPRFYEMTGGTFDEMLVAVKSLSFRRFQTRPAKCWLVKGEGVETLRKQFDVTQLPDLRIKRTIDEYREPLSGKVVPNRRGGTYRTGEYEVGLEFQLRDKERGWKPLRFLPRGVAVNITADAVAAEIEAAEAELRELFKDKPRLARADELVAVRRICARAAQGYAEPLIAAFHAAIPNRTKEEVDAALEQVFNLKK